jgi:hypothetical protein
MHARIPAPHAEISTVTINVNRRRFTVSEDAAGHTTSIVKQAEAQLAATGLELPPTVGHEPKFVGRIGKELNAGQDRSAAYAAVLNVLAVARHHLDKISRVVRLGVSIATAGDYVDRTENRRCSPELLRDIFGEGRETRLSPSRHLMYRNLSNPQSVTEPTPRFAAFDPSGIIPVRLPL